MAPLCRHITAITLVLVLLHLFVVLQHQLILLRHLLLLSSLRLHTHVVVARDHRGITRARHSVTKLATKTEPLPLREVRARHPPAAVRRLAGARAGRGIEQP
jgi:hypothetical protein